MQRCTSTKATGSYETVSGTESRTGGRTNTHAAVMCERESVMKERLAGNLSALSPSSTLMEDDLLASVDKASTVPMVGEEEELDPENEWLRTTPKPKPKLFSYDWANGTTSCKH